MVSICVLFLQIFFWWLLPISIRREVARIVKEEIHNVGVPSQGNKVPSKDNQAPLNEQIPQGDEVPTISPPITDGGIRSSFV